MLKNRMIPTLPRPSEVAARTLGLTALMSRASLEQGGPEAADMHRLVLGWVRRLGVEKSLESDELRILGAPLGTLGRDEVALAAWRQEQVSVFAWALGKVSLPRAHQRHEPAWLARKVGFLDPGAAATIRDASLRPAGELLQYAVVIGEVRDAFEREWRADPARDMAFGLAVATERQQAARWLVGEVRPAIEPRADA